MRRVLAGTVSSGGNPSFSHDKNNNAGESSIKYNLFCTHVNVGFRAAKVIKKGLGACAKKIPLLGQVRKFAVIHVKIGKMRADGIVVFFAKGYNPPLSTFWAGWARGCWNSLQSSAGNS
jgi:hypothetical protein